MGVQVCETALGEIREDAPLPDLEGYSSALSNAARISISCGVRGDAEGGGAGDGKGEATVLVKTAKAPSCATAGGSSAAAAAGCAGAASCGAAAAAASGATWEGAVSCEDATPLGR